MLASVMPPNSAKNRAGMGVCSRWRAKKSGRGAGEMAQWLKCLLSNVGRSLLVPSIGRKSGLGFGGKLAGLNW